MRPLNPFFLRVFLGEAAFRAAVEAAAEEIVQTRIAARIRLYAENPKLLRAATAAYHGVIPAHLPDAPRSQTMISRAIRAFGDELGVMDDAALARCEPAGAGVMGLALGDEAHVPVT